MTDRILPAGAREEFLPLDGGSVRLLRGGPPGGVPVVLVHGGGPDNAAISWFEVFGPLAADRPVLAFDLPGFGHTTGLPVVSAPAAIADLAVRIVAAAGVGRAVWAGVSMGGDVVLNVGLRHPEAVAGLVLVAPGGLATRVGTGVMHTAAWLACRLPDAVLRPLARIANRFTGAAVRAMVHEPASVPPAVVAEMVREARRPDAALGYGRYNQATVGRRGMTNDLSDRVAAIASPALFLHGREDGLVDPAGSRRAAAAMPDARLVLVDACGHRVQIGARERFLGEVATFLRSVEA